MSLQLAPRSVAIDAFLAIGVGPASSPSPVQEVTAFESIGIKMHVDTGDEITFSTTAASPEAVYLDELASDVWVEGILNKRFRVTAIDQAWDDNGGNIVSVTAVSYKRLLNSRLLHADLTFTGEDQGDIVWALIDHTQSQPGGDWGVTQGVTTTGVLRDRTYVQGENIGDLATKLQEVEDGLWWDIDHDLVFNAYDPAVHFEQHGMPLQLGVNMRSLQRKGSAAAQFRNAIYVDGDDQAVTPVWATATDITTDPRGRWEGALGFPTVILQDTLVEHAAGALRAALSPRATWTLVLEAERWIIDSRYMPGDLIVAAVPPLTAAPVGVPCPVALLQVIEVQGGYNASGQLDIAMTAVEVGDPS